ncbi:hypothetical protein K439DRAFT_1297116, partial [Ramaria rubella]
KVQRLAFKLMTGAFRCTAIDTLELHANVPPIQLRLEDSCHREVLRLASLPESHPLYPLVRHCASNSTWHTSKTSIIIISTTSTTTTIETITPIHQHPCWHPQFTAHIAKDEKEAKQCLCTRIDDLQIYTDDSGYKGHIGTLAVDLNSDEHLQYHLGKEARHTVFEGELVGVLLTLQLI